VIPTAPATPLAYNFGHVCLSARLSDYLSKAIFAHLGNLQEIRAKIVYEGHRVKVKVAGAKISKITIPAMYM